MFYWLVLLIRHWIIFYISLVCRVLAIVVGIERRRAEKTMKRQGQSWRSANLVRWTSEKFPPLNAWRENFNDMCSCHWGTGRRRRLELKKYSCEGQVQSRRSKREKENDRQKVDNLFFSVNVYWLWITEMKWREERERGGNNSQWRNEKQIWWSWSFILWWSDVDWHENENKTKHDLEATSVPLLSFIWYDN